MKDAHPRGVHSGPAARLDASGALLTPMVAVIQARYAECACDLAPHRAGALLPHLRADGHVCAVVEKSPTEVQLPFQQTGRLELCFVCIYTECSRCSAGIPKEKS